MTNNKTQHGDCIICKQYMQQDDEYDDLATLSCCKHIFHRDCIEQWSRITNKCPLDKLRFKYIQLLQSNKQIKVENKEQINDSIELTMDEIELDSKWDYIPCQICYSCDPQYDHLCLICDCCELPYHTFCIGLTQIPQTDFWFCSKCQNILNESNKIKCELCHKRFDSQNKCNKHIKRVHTKKSIKCNKCNKTFKRNNDCNAHQKSVHSNKRSFACRKCKKKFFTKNNLVHHQRQTHDKENNYRYHCIECKKGFYKRSDMIKHRRTHTGEKPFQCECKKRFGQKSNLYRHQRKFHGK
eukprot:253934_1